jgi:hypothetical protein
VERRRKQKKSKKGEATTSITNSGAFSRRPMQARKKSRKPAAKFNFRQARRSSQASRGKLRKIMERFMEDDPKRLAEYKALQKKNKA